MSQSSKKHIDCIAMKREAQNRIYEETKGLSPKQQIDYFRNAVRSSQFKQWWEEGKSFLARRASKAS